jgi:hypothetical protein
MNFLCDKWCQTPFQLLRVARVVVSLWFILWQEDKPQRHNDTKKNTEDTKNIRLKSGQWLWDNHA